MTASPTVSQLLLSFVSDSRYDAVSQRFHLTSAQRTAPHPSVNTSFTVTDSDHTRRAFRSTHSFPRFITAPAATPSANAAATTAPLVPRSSPARDTPGLTTSTRQARARDVKDMLNDGKDVNDVDCELESCELESCALESCE